MGKERTESSQGNCDFNLELIIGFDTQGQTVETEPTLLFPASATGVMSNIRRKSSETAATPTQDSRSHFSDLSFLRVQSQVHSLGATQFLIHNLSFSPPILLPI